MLRDLIHWCGVVALLIGCMVSVVWGDIPNLTTEERIALEKAGTLHESLPPEVGPSRYVAPGIEVRERIIDTGMPGSTDQVDILVNGGFEDGTFNGWTTLGAQGTLTPSGCGAAKPAEAFITNLGLMPFANNDPCINFVYRDDHAAQLGDEVAWGRNPTAESKCNSVWQDAVVPAGTSQFVFAYAVLAANPGHGVGQDPYFNVHVEDLTAGVTLYDITDYTTSYDPGNPCNPWCRGANDPYTGVPIVYRCWTEVSLDLSGIAGHTVRVLLKASDCSPNAHFCQAFLDGAGIVCDDEVAPESVTLTGTCAVDPNIPGSFCAALTWNAPSDSTWVVNQQTCVPSVQAAAGYDIRWSTSPIVTDADFLAATQVTGEPTPAAPGTPEAFSFCGLPSGDVYVALRSSDANLNQSAIATVQLTCVDNQDPDCSTAVASPAELWPPKHSFRNVSILGVTDPDGDPVTITVTEVTQDEPLDFVGDGRFCPDARISNGQLQLRAERMGPDFNLIAPPSGPDQGAVALTGNGRVYVVHFTASDGRGGSCEGTVSVCVPHDMRPGHFCIDDGQTVNSFGPCTPSILPPGEPGVGGDDELVVRMDPQGINGEYAVISYGLPADGLVVLSVFDVAGRHVATLENSFQSRGGHSAMWNVARMARGVYFARIQAHGVTLSRPIVVR